MNWSNPYGINKETMETGSYLSSSAQWETFEVNLTYTDPFRVNYYTQLSGSEPRGFISASAEDVTPWGLNTAPINLRDPFRINNNTQETGSGIIISGEFVSFNAPSNTFSEIAAGTGSFVLKHISGPDHQRTFDIQVKIGSINYSSGLGTNKKTAEQIAAKHALEELGASF